MADHSYRHILYYFPKDAGYDGTYIGNCDVTCIDALTLASLSAVYERWSVKDLGEALANQGYVAIIVGTEYAHFIFDKYKYQNNTNYRKLIDSGLLDIYVPKEVAKHG